jgi:3-oxoacyl-[acyl-carrier protein] reductase
MPPSKSLAPQGDVHPNDLGFEASVPSAMVSHLADFDRIEPGDEAHFHRTICANDVDDFARLSGDTNPVHMDEEFAQRTGLGRRVVHGMLLGSYVSTLVGVHCPGSGALWSQQNFRWQAPVFIGDRVHLKLWVTHKSKGSRSLAIAVKGVNQNGKVFMEGEGVVSVLEERVRTNDTAITDRVALVAGTSQAIGAAIALSLAKAGAMVVVDYESNPGAAEKLCAAIESNGGHSIPEQMNILDGDSVRAAVLRIQEKLRRPIDLLVNSPGNSPEGKQFVETTWEEVHSSLELHLRGTFHCCQAVIPGMCAKRSGIIINIGSAFLRGNPPANWSSFLMAKSVIQALTRSLAVELGPQGIRVNMVSPGLLETDSIDGSDRLRKVQAMQTPLRRLAAPADIASVVLALSSRAGDFITGTDIPVCGGFHM